MDRRQTEPKPAKPSQPDASPGQRPHTTVLTTTSERPRRRNCQQQAGNSNRSDSTATHQKKILATEEAPKAQTFGGRADLEAAQRASQIPQSRPRPRSRRQISSPLPGARSNQRRPANRGRGDLAEVWAGLGWWEPGSHGVGAGALLLRRPVAQGASRGREEAGMPVCCLLVARNVDLGHTQSLIVEQHVRVQRRGIGGIVLLSAMTIVHSIVSLAI